MIKTELELENRVIIDISPTINARMAVFPGDTPFQEEFISDMRNGDGYTLSFVKTSVHIGAHADAPLHYAPNGVPIHVRPLQYYMGQAQVIEVTGKRGQRITLGDLDDQKVRAPRVLFKTDTFPDPYQWNHDFASLSGELIDMLAQQGVKLVGIDTPSIDPADDKALESHQAVFRHDMAILEGIVLNHVQPGLYDLIALPLPIEGADATPVRAVLLKENT